MSLLLLFVLLYGYFGIRSIYRLTKGTGTKKDKVMVFLFTLLIVLYSSTLLPEQIADILIPIGSVLAVGIMYYLIWLSVKTPTK